MQSPQPRVVLFTIVIGLLIWGAALALGAMLNDETGTGLMKGAIVGGCTLGFLGFWGAMLWLHRRPDTDDDDQLPEHDNSK